MDKYQPSFSSTIKNEELNWLSTRRKIAKLPEPNENNTKAIALSGGGIRSATFNLGVLQAFENAKRLNEMDYMSSVSGGGYIASALTWFKAKLPDSFPFGTKRVDHNKLGGQVISWIRAHSSFLTPGNGITFTSLLSALFTGTVINLLIIIPIFILVFLGLSIPFNMPWSSSTAPVDGFILLRQLALFALSAGFISMIITALSTSMPTATRGKLTEKMRQVVSYCFTAAIVSFAIGIIPMLHMTIDKLTDMLIHASFSLSILGIVISWYSASKTQSDKDRVAPIIVALGLFISCLGIVMFAYHLTTLWHNIPYYYYALLGLSFVLAAGCNINLVSMHGYYRNRLRDAFMPHTLPAEGGCPKKEVASWMQAQQCYLKDLPISNAPFHLVNCNIELTGSKQSKYRNRAGDAFMFSSLYCGSTATGYSTTDSYLNGQVDLASVVAISGAAVATNTTRTRSRAVNFLMASLNLRLGCWVKNPKDKGSRKSNFPMWYNAVFNDMFGIKLNENQPYVHLSDGGHFENLGVYELVRRKVKLIFAFDVGADSEYKFHDLGKMTELIRVDFGAKLTIDITPLIPNSLGESKSSWVKGVIEYEDKTQATFIYVKSSISHSAQLSEDINSYKRENPDFPHQSTANQFFNEIQFEAYRELGFQITHRLLKEEADLFEASAHQSL